MERLDSIISARARILDIIDRRRAETGDPALGSSIEHAIMRLCLLDLEATSADHPMGERLMKMAARRLCRETAVN